MADPDPRTILEELGEVFDDLFGPTSGAAAAPDLRMELVLEPEDLARGKRPVTVRRLIGCETCHGSGREPSETERCAGCGGRGQTLVRKGSFQRAVSCVECGGTGSARVCAHCGGSGGETREETLRVVLPPRVRDGQTLRLRGKGSDRSDGEGPGDLYVTVRIPAQRPRSIPVAESAEPAPGGWLPWLVLGAAVVAIVVAAALLR